MIIIENKRQRDLQKRLSLGGWYAYMKANSYNVFTHLVFVPPEFLNKNFIGEERKIADVLLLQITSF